MTTGYQEGKCVRTRYEWQEEEGRLRICSASGETSLIPDKRDYAITFCGIKDAQVMGSVLSDGRKMEVMTEKGDDMTVSLKNVPSSEDIVLALQGIVNRDNEVLDWCYKILDRAAIGYDLKESVLCLIEKQADTTCLLGELLALELDRNLCSALVEVITA